MKSVYFLLIMICCSNVRAQSKREQMENLLYRLDSLTIVHSMEKEKMEQSRHEFENTIKDRDTKIEYLNDSLQILHNQLKKLNNDVQMVTNDLNNVKLELGKQIDSLKQLVSIQTVKWSFDTFEAESKMTPCFSYSDLPYCYVRSAPLNEELLKLLNLKLNDFKYKIPEILNGQPSNLSNYCNEWNENLCDRPWQVYNRIESINAKKYFSILQWSAFEFCGATVAQNGFSSFNFDNSKGEEIVIPESVSNKNVLSDEIKKYFKVLKIKEPIHETSSGIEPIRYDQVLSRIIRVPMNDLTFFFKEDVLHLKFYDYEDSWTYRTYEIPLPIFQVALGL